MLARHRRESKELQAQVMTLKAGIPKGDKKKKKAAAAEIARLEGDLAERHTAELLEGLTVVEEVKQETLKEEGGSGVVSGPGRGDRVSKAQKRRERKAEREREREAEIEHQEEENRAGQRAVEQQQIRVRLEARGLTMREVLLHIPLSGLITALWSGCE